mgnify:CR=1 FL=1|jgi:transcriptional regulator with XRE-family HTH domain
MQITLKKSPEIGSIIRAVRKSQRIRQDDAAGSMGVSESFLGKVEKGSETVQWGKLFEVLDGLGVRVVLDIPDAAADKVSQLVHCGVRDV